MVVQAADIQDADGLWGLPTRVKPLYDWLRGKRRLGIAFRSQA